MSLTQAPFRQILIDEKHILPSDTVKGAETLNLLMERLTKLGCEERDIFGIRMALEEALVNAVKHGNLQEMGEKAPDELKQLEVHFDLMLGQIEPTRITRLRGEKRDKLVDKHVDTLLRTRVRDHGLGFNPQNVPTCLDDAGLAKPSGRGLFLMRHYMDEVHVQPAGPGMQILMVMGLNRAKMEELELQVQ